jgi:hypothetical protein
MGLMGLVRVVGLMGIVLLADLALGSGYCCEQQRSLICIVQASSIRRSCCSHTWQLQPCHRDSSGQECAHHDLSNAFTRGQPFANGLFDFRQLHGDTPFTWELVS